MTQPGLTYDHEEFRDSQVHVLTVDLTKRSIRPVLAADAFPFLRVYPAIEAVEQGALACVGGGYNTVWYHGQGYADQPLHALVVDREIWTTGMGAGGDGLLIGERGVSTRQNRIRVVVWRPDGSSFEVERINRGHDARIVAFTRRGGTNQRAIERKHYVLLGQPGWWTPADHGEAQRRTMIVQQVSMFDPIAAEGDTVVLEARWPMKLHEGDEVSWVQRLGGHDVRYIASGLPEIVRGGENVVPLLNLDPRAPGGPDNWWVRVNPRMAIGASKDGDTAYIVTVQGRIPGSKGLRLKPLAELMLKVGAYSAVNFDGGGSAFMYVRDEDPPLIADSTYGDGTLQGLRPDHYAVSVF